jgi:hypothetical protein
LISKHCVEFTSPLAKSPHGFSLILLLDKNLAQEEIAMLSASVETLSAASSPSWLGLIVFGKHVTVYRLRLGGVASCDVFTSLASFAATPEHQRHSFIAPAVAGRDCLSSTLSVLRGARLKVDVGSAPRSARRPKGATEKLPRALGEKDVLVELAGCSVVISIDVRHCNRNRSPSFKKIGRAIANHCGDKRSS